MQGFSAARRPKAKIIKSTVEDEDDDVKDVTSGTESLELEPPTIPAIRRLNRPPLTKKGSGSKLKLSFGADEVFISTSAVLIGGRRRRADFYPQAFHVKSEDV